MNFSVISKVGLKVFTIWPENGPGFHGERRTPQPKQLNLYCIFKNWDCVSLFLQTCSFNFILQNFFFYYKTHPGLRTRLISLKTSFYFITFVCCSHTIVLNSQLLLSHMQVLFLLPVRDPKYTRR